MQTKQVITQSKGLFSSSEGKVQYITNIIKTIFYMIKLSGVQVDFHHCST